MSPKVFFESLSAEGKCKFCVKNAGNTLFVEVQFMQTVMGSLTAHTKRALFNVGMVSVETNSQNPRLGSGKPFFTWKWIGKRF